jgi:hypothetical protein
LRASHRRAGSAGGFCGAARAATGELTRLAGFAPHDATVQASACRHRYYFLLFPFTRTLRKTKRRGQVANLGRCRKPKTRTAEDMEDAHSYTTCRRDRHDW